MVAVKPPVFVIEANDVSVHSSLEDAALQLEPIDVKDNLYAAYDSEGRLLHLEPEGHRVKISLVEEVPRHGHELEEALRRYLTAIGKPEGRDPQCDLPCLVEVCKEFIVHPRRSFKSILKGLFTTRKVP